jgi:hypothetical protein
MVEEILDGVNGVLWLGLQLAGQLHVRPAGTAAGGTRIDMVAVFDNSVENLRQPSRLHAR